MDKMKRNKRHKVKSEKPETSTSYVAKKEEYDLTYYIHDRVELMHQVFSVLKPKDLKAMAPDCVRHISIDDLQELCTEELLGISSKRLCAILDGAEPPSDTESSSASPSPRVETISLDSISSDDEILSQTSSTKKKHKHRRSRKHKRRSHREGGEGDREGEGAESRAQRAGLTVLELLELQARARAIRAQLHQDTRLVQASETAASGHHSDNDDVEIKEEPAEVVEISSDDEKPNIDQLQANASKNNKSPEQTPNQSVTKRINDLIITVPQSKPSRKIKLNRTKVVAAANTENNVTPKEKTVVIEVSKESTSEKTVKEDQKTKDKTKKKTRKKEKKKTSEKGGSDHDEITLQLSDTEKMDLLEDLDRKNYEKLSSSEDSESSSETDSDSSSLSEKVEEIKAVPENKELETDKLIDVGNINDIPLVTDVIVEDSSKQTENNHYSNANLVDKSPIDGKDALLDKEQTAVDKDATVVEKEPILVENQSTLVENETSLVDKLSSLPNKDAADITDPILRQKVNEEDKVKENEKIITEENKASKEATKSDGELSDRASSDVEACELQPEVVCISDGEEKKHKKKKKEKKNKKEKKLKTKLDRDNDQKCKESCPAVAETKEVVVEVEDDQVLEIMELSDDSSCYEVECILSKEPTVAEIEALSAKIDEFEREEVVTEAEIREYENREKEKSTTEEQLENMSWKDRYLDSKKVKKVLTTSNIFNVLRKKNRELKKKLEDSKQETVVETVPVEQKAVEEGTIDHFNTLEGSTKYVDPVVVPEKQEPTKVSKEMEKDAKQLLKMYKKLLKYNDMNRQRDPSKKKKKKSKKKHKESESNTK